MDNTILTKAAGAGSARQAAQVVLDELVRQYDSAADVPLEQAKSLLVDAMRAWRASSARRLHAAQCVPGVCEPQDASRGFQPGKHNLSSPAASAAPLTVSGID